MVGEELKAAAFHEAGHATFCHLAGYRIAYVSVATAERPGQSDRCQHDYPKQPKSEDVLAHLLISLAGTYAEYQATHGEPMAHQPYEDFLACVIQDARDFRAGLEEIPTDPMNAQESITLSLSKGAAEDVSEKLYIEACRQTASLVEEYWPEIEAVAAKLQEAGYLEGEEVGRVIAGVRERTAAV